LFSLPTTLSAPSRPQFHLSSLFTSPSSPLPTHHYTIPPSCTLTTCWLAYCTNCMQPPPPAIPDTNTLQYNNRNMSKHTQGPQNPAAPITLNPPTHPFSHHPFLVLIFFTNSPKSITSLITITPPPTNSNYL
jgi:hypothetical protein